MGKAKAPHAPWDDCKVAFGIENDKPLDDYSLWTSKDLPDGWELDEVDGSGARWVAVFRIRGLPTPEAGRAVKRWLRKVGAL